MNPRILGNGWRFPIVPDERGALGYVAGDDNVEQSLRILLLTAAGERMMRPDFGTEAPRLVFAPGSVQFLRLLETSVREAIRDWEPRVDLLDVRAEADADEPARVRVSIDYRVRRTNAPGNLVFPFYVGTLETGR